MFHNPVRRAKAPLAHAPDGTGSVRQDFQKMHGGGRESRWGVVRGCAHSRCPSCRHGLDNRGWVGKKSQKSRVGENRKKSVASPPLQTYRLPWLVSDSNPPLAGYGAFTVTILRKSPPTHPPTHSVNRLFEEDMRVHSMNARYAPLRYEIYTNTRHVPLHAHRRCWCKH